MAELIEEAQNLESTTVKIDRTAAVVKGGRRFSFAALVVVGDRNGSVGIGYGKAPGVPAAIEKAQKDARKNLQKVFLRGGTIPHPVTGKFGASQVRLIPAAPGTGISAGGTVRAVLEMAGVHDCLSKSNGSTNQKNLVKACMQGLLSLRTREEIAQLRGITIEKSMVDEKIELGERYMPKSTGEGQKAEAPKNVVGKGRGQGRRGGGDSRGPRGGHATNERSNQAGSSSVASPDQKVTGDATVEQPQPSPQTDAQASEAGEQK